MTELIGGGTAGRGTSASVTGLTPDTVDVVPVRAILLGERLDTRAFERDEPLGIAPLTVDIPGGGVAVLFRYGAVVLFGAATAALDNFVASLRPLVTAALPVSERDDARLVIRAEADQVVDLAGNIFLTEKTTERLQVVADILAKGLVLSHYETRIADIFDGIEPLAATLREKGRAGARSKELLRHIGDVLLMQQKMVGAWKPAKSRSCYGTIPSSNAFMCGSPRNTSCATGTGRSTASSTSSRAPLKLCSA
jgi:hypothetical protein